MGILEAFDLAEQVGRDALPIEDLIFIAMAKKRRGCCMMSRKLTPGEMQRVISIGEMCLVYKRAKERSK